MKHVLGLHGFTGSGEAWNEVFGALPSYRDVDSWLPDLLGHGTEKDSGVTSFDDEIERLARGLEERGWSDVYLAGYSLGARVGLGLLARHPDRFAGALLVGVHPGLAGEDERRERIAEDELWARLLEDRGIEAFVERWEKRPIFASQENLDAELRAAQRRVRSAQDPRGLARALRVLGLGRMPDLRSALGELGLHTSIVAGELDFKFRELAWEMARAMPNARVIVVPRAGHNVLLEQPGWLATALETEFRQ